MKEIERINEIISKTSLNKDYILTEVERGVRLEKFNECERKVINLVEDRGLSGFRYKKIIDICVEYINKALNEEDGEIEGIGTVTINGNKYNDAVVQNFEIDIPSELFNWVDIFNSLHIKANVKNIIGDFNREDEIKFYPVDNGKYTINSTMDYDYKTKKLDNVNIEINCYALNDKLNVHSFTSVFYHEFNHAYENYNLLKNSSGARSMSDINSHMRYKNSIMMIKSKHKSYNKVGWILYRLWDKSELISGAASIYAELKEMGSKRGNFIKDIERTNSYKRYKMLKKYIDDIKNEDMITDTLWKNIAYLMGNYKNINIDDFKNSFIKRSYMLLDKYFRQMGKVASLYYDESEGIKLNGKNKEIKYE